ncbi:MAG: enolase C-terminal domain-like protein [Candidatus Bathyarchaeia archaeon]
MKIIDIETTVFKYKTNIIRDCDGHVHPGPEHYETYSLTRIVTDEGIDGLCFGGDKDVIEHVVKPIIIGKNPMERESIWQKLHWASRLLLSEETIAVVDMALWDFAGKYLDQPVYRLLGGHRDKIPAYASTMCGDDIDGGLNTPEAYADFAEKCMKQGYTAFKMHSWMYPYGPDPKRDIAACAAVKERVGDKMRLMLDPHHFYTKEEALYIGRHLEKLGFYWFEEPMDEYNVSSYVWLANKLEIPIVGPESAGGMLSTRAEWIIRGASDISRYGVHLGGITPLMKTVHLCEAFGVRLEVHGGGAASLQCLAAMSIPGEYYERGLLHPLVDYEKSQPWLRSPVDPIDSQGYVHVSDKPGIYMDIDWDFIEENSVKNK